MSYRLGLHLMQLLTLGFGGQSVASTPLVPVTFIGPNNATEIISNLEFPELANRHNPTRPFTIQVEGIVGTGKSTMLGAFKNYPQMDIIPEPVGEWTNFNGTDVLNLLMTNPHRWATTQEFLAYNSMINEHLRRLGLVKAMERSIHSARLCFAEVLKTEGKISDAEYAILDYWYKFLTNKEAKYPTGFDTEADIIIYLQTTPEVANQRINGRGRSEESTIQMSYLEHLHEAHENWLIRGTSGFDVPAKRVLVLNTDHPLEVMMGVYHKLAEKIWATIPKDLKSVCTS